MKKSCDWMRQRMARYIDGELPADERAAFEAHLRGCPRCEHLYDTLRQLDRLTAAAGRDAEGAEQRSAKGGATSDSFARFRERYDLQAAARARDAEMADGAAAGERAAHWSPEEVAQAPLEA
ncbi:MAG: hypothetical protein GF330_07115, partial [Candidatus Eisenbacteria bacterium]|nr:hypothetical protein [Candidatus Eisenbacteria bacterium]